MEIDRSSEARRAGSDRGRREHFRLLEAEWRGIAERDARAPLLETGRCALGCGAAPRHLFARLGTPFVECPECGLVFVGRQLSEEALAEHFARSEAWEVWARDVLPDPVQRASDCAKFERALDQVDRLRAHGSAASPAGATDDTRADTPLTPGRVFDVGANAGVFLSVARERGWEVAGCEASRAACELARELHGIDLVPGRFEDAPVRGDFDLVTFWASLEYCKHPARVLERALAWLRPGGLLLVFTSGNAHSLVMRVLRERCVGFLFNRLWYFAPESLDRLILRPGVERVARHSVIPSLDVIARGLEYASDPYDGARQQLFDEAELGALAQIISAKHMGYKFQTLYRKT